MKIIKNIKLKIDEEEVLRYQGCCNDNSKKVNKIIIKITREEIKRGLKLIETTGISCTVRIKQISFSSKRVDLESNFSLNLNHSIIHLLRGTTDLVLGVVTIGNALEDKVSELFSQGEYPRAIALDAVGTVSVRALRDYMNSLLCQETKEQNLQTTKYFSPGSADWDISQQKNIFQMIPVDKIGVKLTESYMMVPQKSLSWITGIGKNMTLSSKDEHSCQICQATNCQFRKIFE